MDDESRRALRELARRAEWAGRPGAAGAAQDARTLRELGREIEIALAREPDTDSSAWAYRAAASLAAYSQRARPDWTVEQIAELARLREDAITALAPGPGEPQSDLAAKPARRSALAALGSRRPAVLALAVVSGLVLVALILTLPHLLSNDASQTPAASATTTLPAAPTTQPSTTPATTSSSTATSSASAGTPTATASTSTTSASTPTSRVTQIQVSPEPQQGYPEVIVSGSVTTSGIGDVTINITVTGGASQPQVTPIDDSGQTTYNLTQTIYLNQWCGQSSVHLTVSSGSISQSFTVPISGC